MGLAHGVRVREGSISIGREGLGEVWTTKWHRGTLVVGSGDGIVNL